MFQTRTLKQGRTSKTDVFFRDMDSLKLDVTIWYTEGWHLVATEAKSVVGKPLAMPATREKTVWQVAAGGRWLLLKTGHNEDDSPKTSLLCSLANCRGCR